MILHNATILTGDLTMPQASALAIAGGKVLGGVDSREDAIASHAHERIDLGGATVVPGFVDSHVHFHGWCLQARRLDLHGCTSWESVRESITDAMERAASGDGHDYPDGSPAWIRAVGLHDVGNPGTESPRVFLDSCSPTTAIAIESYDGHTLWLNTAALQALQVDIHSMECAPEFCETEVDGESSGVFREHAAWIVRLSLPDSDVTVAEAAQAARTAVARGVTTIHDVDGARGFALWQQLAAERGLPLRVVQHFVRDDLPHLAALNMGSGFGDGRLRIGGIKVFADGTLGSGTAWLHEPELVPPGQEKRQQTPLLTQAELTSVISEAAGANLPVLVHAIGDAAVTMAVDAFEATHGLWQDIGAMPRIEHAQLMRPADIQRCAELGIALSVQPTHLLHDRATADARWGDERSRNAYAFRSMIDAGAIVAFGSDAPIEDINPLRAIAAAVERAESGEASWNQQQCITREEALLASCVWPHATLPITARNGGVSGLLHPGQAADLVVLSGNPLNHPIAEIEVVATMVAGKWVYGRTNIGNKR